jgi:ABC-type dipeptide/oligopeptide/nickel transport system permease subunit
LLGGQVLPFLLPLLVGFGLSPRAAWMGVVAAALAILPRLLAAVTYRQPFSSALLHPIGVVALVIIQWQALFRQFAGRPSEWKGRRYFPAAAVPAHQSLPDSVR